MSKKLAVILACSALVSYISSDVQALTVLSHGRKPAAPDVTLVRDFVGGAFTAAHMAAAFATARCMCHRW